MAQFLVLGLVTLVMGASAQAATKRTVHTSKNTNNIELWCGATMGQDKEKFPYLTAIKNFRAKNGRPMQVASVYEKGHLVLRQYVYRHPRIDSTAYESYGNAFSLSLKNHKGNSTWAEFKAVIRDEDGTKLVGNGAIPCYLHGKHS